MKRASLFSSLFVISISVSFCSKSTGSQGPIVGKWKVDSTQIQFRTANQELYFKTIYIPKADYHEYTKDSFYRSKGDTNQSAVSYSIVTSNGQTIIEYLSSIEYAPTGDTILSLTNHSLVVKNFQDGGTRIFMTK